MGIPNLTLFAKFNRTSSTWLVDRICSAVHFYCGIIVTNSEKILDMPILPCYYELIIVLWEQTRKRQLLVHITYRADF